MLDFTRFIVFVAAHIVWKFWTQKGDTAIKSDRQVKMFGLFLSVSVEGILNFE